MHGGGIVRVFETVLGPITERYIRARFVAKAYLYLASLSSRDTL